MSLTARRKELLDYIRQYMKQNQMAPTYAEIMQALKIASRGHVAQFINNLIRDGYLVRKDSETRGLSIVERGWQPIETAPRDRPVLVCGDKEVGTMAEFSQWIAVAKYDHDMDLISRGITPVFVYAEGHKDQLARQITPSKWMELPEE